MIYRLQLQLAFVVTLVVATGTVFGGEAVLTVEPVCGKAIAGVPVVVALTYHNQAAQDVSVAVPVDPYVVYVKWIWKSPNGDSYQITVRNLHHRGIPGRGPMPRVTLAPGQEKTWYSLVPTPQTFGSEKTWELQTTVIDHDPINQLLDRTTVSIFFSCHNYQGSSVLELLGFSLAQAAIVRPAGKVLSEEQLQLVESQEAQGDMLATLVMLSDAIDKKDHVLKYWKRLDEAPSEMKCAQNCLLWKAVRERRWTLPENELQKLLQAIADEQGPFLDDVREYLRKKKPQQENPRSPILLRQPVEKESSQPWGFLLLPLSLSLVAVFLLMFYLRRKKSRQVK